MEKFLDIVPSDRVVEIENPSITCPFELDPFQKQGQFYIEQNHNILISAPTSSGKTFFAECAIAHSKRLGKKCIYTSPVKALSNQKYYEFSKKFGDVGLLTGDIKCNPDAQCLIMTTEILRNMLQKSSDVIKDVHCVVFDEVHYVNNLDRGTVWEQCFIQLPSDITLILLSATISEPDKFAEWIGNLKQRPIHLITTNKRPVPLNHYVYFDNKLHILLNNKGFNERAYQEYARFYCKLNNPLSLLNPFVKFLQTERLTPAIFFIFSRKKCFNLANKVSVCLVDRETAIKIDHLIDSYLIKHTIEKTVWDRLPQVVEIRRLLVMGIGVHHSGLLPILKEITELLFAQGLLQLLFATETFAVGVNMPTRTVVFPELTKFCDGYDQPRMINPDEYLQMSGRAGRRGLDKYGTVIHLPFSEVYDKTDIRNLLLGTSSSIDSKFKLNYAFVLNHLNPDIITHSYLYKQNNELLLILNNKLEIKQKELADLHITENDESTFRQLERLNNQLKCMHTSGGFKVKINKSEEKKLRTQIASLTNKVDLPKFNTYLNSIKDIQDIKSQIHYLQTNIDDQYQTSFNDLVQMGYIENGALTHKGVIASYISSGDEILLTELILNDLFIKLDLPSMASVISLFCDDTRGDDTQSGILPKEVYNLIDWIFELNHNSETILTDKYAYVVYLWISGKSYFDILPHLPTFEGDFIRAMLKFSHICDELLKVCEVIQYPILEKKLIDIKQLLVRDIITSDSLYLKL